MTPSIDILLGLAIACIGGCGWLLVWLFRTVTLDSGQPASVKVGHSPDSAGGTGGPVTGQARPAVPQAWPEPLRSWSASARQLHESDRCEEEALYRYLRRRQFGRHIEDITALDDAYQRLHRNLDARCEPPPSPAGDAEGGQGEKP